MPHATLCRLCVSSGNEYKTLFDDNGQLNRIFKIAIKYFDPILLISGHNHTSNVICIECWQHIEDFYGYQQTVIKSQAQLEFQQPIMRLTRLEDESFKRVYDAFGRTKSSTACIREELDNIFSDTQIDIVNIFPDEDPTIYHQQSVIHSPKQLELTEDLLNAIFDCNSQTSADSVNVPVAGQIDDTGTILPNVETISYQKSFINSPEQPELNDDLINTVFDCDNQTSVASVTSSAIEQVDNISSNTQLDSPIISPHTATSVFELIKIQDMPSQVHTNRKDKQIKYDAFIAKWKGDLKCVICKRQFSTYSMLSKHFQFKHHGIKCHTICCGQKILYRFKLVDHIQKYHIGKTIALKKCKFCTISLTDDSQLRKHALKFHKDMLLERHGEFKCEMCKSTFTRESNFRNHCRIKHAGYPLPEYNCNKCTMIYKSKFSFEKHTKKYHSEETKDFSLHRNKSSSLSSTSKTKDEYRCNICQRSFTSKRNMSIHKRRAHDDKYRNIATNCKRLKLEHDALIAKLRGKLECVLCKRLFDTFTLLHRHFQDHHGGQQCHIVCCSRKLYIRSQILRHIRKWHNEETIKSFKCLSCTAAFYDNDELRKHVVEIHKLEDIKNKGRYYCDICFSTFGKEPKLRQHYRLKHDGCPLPEYSCKQCNLVFKTLHIMEKHNKKEHYNQTANKNEILQTSECSTLEIVEEIQEKHETEFYKFYRNTSNNENNTETLDNSKDSSSEEEEENEFQDLINIIDQTQLTSQNIAEGNNRLNSSIIDSHIIKEEISIYPSDAESETNQQFQINTIDYQKNPIKDLTFDYFTNSTLTKASTTQYDAFIRKWKGDLECPKCPKEMYKNFSMLGQHFRKKHNERPFIICCNLKLISRYPICAHLCLHLNPNAYQCDVCGKRFKTSWNLRNHKSHVHGNARLCKCYKQTSSKEYDRSVCCRRKQRRLQNDAKIANLQKEVECYHCQSKFPYFSLLNNHFRFEHPKEKFHIECCALKLYKASEIIKHFLEH